MNKAFRLVSKTLFKINNSETKVFPALVGAKKGTFKMFKTGGKNITQLQIF